MTACSKQVFTKRWIVGEGLRAPLGETQLSYDNGTPNLDLQPGSGAWGALVYTTFTFKYKWLGWRNNISFLHNGQVLGISRETFRKWKYIRKEDKATIPADKLAIIANFFEIRFEKLFNYSVPQVSFEELEEADRTHKNQNL